MPQYVKPPLKWAGGKFRLLPVILPALEVFPSSRRLVEPFAGSGAVFLNAPHSSCLVCDTNRDLIELYTAAARSKAAFIQRCKEYFTPQSNTAETFYRLREAFNGLAHGEERAAVFLYLNRHAYNGLVRYNAKGLFNTPFGRYKAPYFPQTELEALVRRTEEADIAFAVSDFRDTFAALRKGDVVYCDPPYIPLSATANFTEYTSGPFGPEEQRALAKSAAKAARKGIPVLISNHDVPFSRELYRQATVTSFPVRRFISCDGANRATAQELLAVYS